MTEQQAGSEGGQPPPEPAQSPPPQQQAGAQPHARAEAAPRARLPEWQGPVFWMACGALLAGLAAGAVVLAQRVGIERDLMAVATTLPAHAAKAGVPPATEAGPKPDRTAPERESADTAGPAALSGASGEQPAISGSAASPEAKPAMRHRTRSASPVVAQHGSNKVAPRKRTGARRKAIADTGKYSEVFKRCPPPGQAGAVECRRHICNGAESEGPACRPYRGKLR
ncbi:hypothetical protein [Pseudoduganella sp. HUAS MS19]